MIPDTQDTTANSGPSHMSLPFSFVTPPAINRARGSATAVLSRLDDTTQATDFTRRWLDVLNSWDIASPNTDRVELWQITSHVLSNRRSDTYFPIGLDKSAKVLSASAIDSAAEPERTDLKVQIKNLLTIAGSDNWDGEKAQAVSEAAVRVALELVDNLPAGIEDPDVAATSHGEVDFDWMAGRGAMLTISIGSDGTLAWAALFDEYRSRGTARWTGKLVCPVDCCLQHFASL